MVHDYSGHPFQPRLSRQLAGRGHYVLHAHSASVQIPQGILQKNFDDASTLDFVGIRLSTVIKKQAYLQRFFLERAYGGLLETHIGKFRPDIVVSSSTPLDAQEAALRATRKVGGKFVYWLQDIQGVAIQKLLGSKFYGAGKFVGKYYTALERRLLAQSDAVISITDDFTATLREWGVPMAKVHVIPNWASMEELPQRPKDNPWARAHGMAGKFVFMYTGTIGLKHNPEYLLRLAEAYRNRPPVEVMVVSEGAKAEWLKKERVRMGLKNLHVLPFQPYKDVPDMMGAADVLVAVLDPEAGTFSVPSKVLSYHCAGRPLLLSVPSDNLAARIVTRANSGVVVEPGDIDLFLKKAEELRASPQMRQLMGENALRYARETFDMERITDRFEALFESLVGPRQEPIEEERALANERA